MDDLLVDIREFTQVESAFSNGRLELERFLESPRRSVRLMGTEYDLTRIINDRLSKEAKRLYALITDKWKRNPTIQQFWVVRGGATLFQTYLKALTRWENALLCSRTHNGPMDERRRDVPACSESGTERVGSIKSCLKSGN